MRNSWTLRAAFLLSVIGYFLLAYFVERHEHQILITCFTLVSIGYGVFWKLRHEIGLKTSIFLAIGLRLIFLFSIPALSDDIFRFIWDGHVWLSGIHPFASTPLELLESHRDLSPGLNYELFELLNSQERYTVYPPVSQFVFYLAGLLGQNSILGSTVVIRFFLLAIEVLTIVLLPKLLRIYGLSPANAILYTLNPLVIVEIIGNLHFEGAWIGFLLICLLLLARNKFLAAGTAYALAICSKLIPLLFAPLFLRYLKLSSYVKFGVYTLLATIALFLPLLNQALFDGMFDSLDLYFRKFEFNASFYYLVRWFGWQTFGYNIIQTAGPALAKLVIVFTGYFLLLLNPKKVKLPEAMMWTLTVYLLLSTTVHPWYITPVVFLATLTRYRYGVVWSLLAFLTYLGYSLEGYHEYTPIIILEYVVVLIILTRELFGSGYLIELYHKVRT